MENGIWYQVTPYKTDDDWASGIKAEQTQSFTKPMDAINELHHLGHKYEMVEVEGFSLYRYGADFIQPVHFFEDGEQSSSDTEILELMEYYR